MELDQLADDAAAAHDDRRRREILRAQRIDLYLLARRPDPPELSDKQRRMAKLIRQEIDLGLRELGDTSPVNFDANSPRMRELVASRERDREYREGLIAAGLRSFARSS